jgi:lipopolysaccharide/colanic/teichoic acid biosynthesis glycosyltransferase
MKPVNRTRILFAVFDLCLVAMVTIVIAYFHDGLRLYNREGSYLIAFLAFPVFWLLLSMLTRKFRIGERSNQREVFISVMFSNFVILSVTAILIVFFKVNYFSRFVLFGTIAGITFFEILTGLIYVAIQNSVFLKDWIGMEIPEAQTRFIAQQPPIEALSSPKNIEFLRESICEEAGAEAFTWIRSRLDITDPKSLIISTNTRFNIVNHPNGYFTSLVNLQRINHLQRINKFFETVNAKLPVDGIFIGCAETYMLRKERILSKFPPVLNFGIYAIDFLLNRVLPKLVITRKLYFLLTRGKKRVMSRTETLGRLFSCGFEVLEEKSIGEVLFLRAKKIQDPLHGNDPNYGIFIRLQRVGKNGKVFKVYKLRTMHVYAEFVQGYIYDNNSLDKGGKFKNDFRVTTLGRILRKFWLDELPMLINLLKGDMKIVGVRPLSQHFYNLYSEELKKKRIQSKPGLIPPYYAQYPTPETLADVQKNEMEYLLKHEKHPFCTDVKYFFKALYNIVWKRARSK